LQQFIVDVDRARDPMATQDDVRAIALSLPGVSEGETFGFGVEAKGKVRGFAWIWLERVHPKKARVPNPEVIAVATPNLTAKEVLIASNPEAFFTEPHYNGYSAVLVRLAAISTEDLRDVLVEGWRSKAPKELLRQLDGAR
jgi:hypothetical protein